MVETTIGVQTLGVGLAAFIATLAASFLFVNAYHERLARAFGYAMAAAALWGWFGFVAAIAAEHGTMDLARTLRAASMAGNVLLAVLFVRFALIYKSEQVSATHTERLLYDLGILGAAAFMVLLSLDVFVGTATTMGPFFRNTVTPMRGPMFDIFVLYYCLCIAWIYVLMRARVAREQGPARRGHLILMYAMTVGASAGVAGFVAWYGISNPLITAIRAFAMPLLAVGSFYAMSSHNIFNVRVAAANVFVFAIWTFLFFRILLNPSLSDSLPDILLLAALIVLGVLLIRSFSKELDTRVRIERAERERAIEQSKAEFISIAAHQLRTPLSGIRWTFNMLENAPEGLTPEQRELVKKAGERTRDVVDRVNEMLRAARYSGGGFTMSLKPQDIRPVLKESTALFENIARSRNLELVATIPRKVLTSRIDKDKFAIAVQNLIDNALKYTKSGTVRLDAEQTGDTIEIRVSDSGIGITPHDSEHLFEKFYRNENATKMFTDGSGLGLFIVKKIVDAHGGTIAVESKPNSGTTFTIRIPALK